MMDLDVDYMNVLAPSIEVLLVCVVSLKVVTTKNSLHLSVLYANKEMFL